MTPIAQPVTSDAEAELLAWWSVNLCETTGWDTTRGQLYCWQREGHDGPHFDEAFGWWRVKEEAR